MVSKQIRLMSFSQRIPGRYERHPSREAIHSSEQYMKMILNTLSSLIYGLFVMQRIDSIKLGRFVGRVIAKEDTDCRCRAKR